MASTPFEPDARLLDWLLEESNPSVRYFALRDLLGRPASDREVRKAKAAIMKHGPVPRILERQEPEGSWRKPEQFYTGKYSSTVWTLLVLAELGADGSDPRIRPACDLVLDRSQDRSSGGFAMFGSANGGQHSQVIPCLTGNMLWALVRLGFEHDPRVQQAIEWIVTYQRFDDGDGDPKGWPYDQWEICWGKHTCHMGVVKSMKALAEFPASKRSPAMKDLLARAAEFMLIHHVYKRSHNPGRASKPGWRHFGFPLMYQTDALEILNLLLDLGYRDARMDAAAALVASKQGADGRWLMKNSYNHSLIVPIEEKGAPSKWITLHALKALTRYGVPEGTAA